MVCHLLIHKEEFLILVLLIKQNHIVKNFVQRHHPFLAPSNGSTADAFFKARISFSPVYHHNELATKYAHISTIPDKSSEIKYSIMRFV